MSNLGELVEEDTKKEDMQKERILRNLSRTFLDVHVLLGEKEYEIGDLMSLSPGSILLFENSVEESACISVNGKKFAYGDVVQVNDMYGLRISNMATENS